MRKMVSIVVFCTFIGVPIHVFSGQDDAITETSERVILVTPEHCQLLNSHIPNEDVKYKADEDVRGNKLVPAEIKSSNNLIDDKSGYSFFMTHDALKNSRLNLGQGVDGANEGKIILGQVTVKDGDVLWNGASLKERDRERLYLLCKEQRKKRPIIKR